MNETTDNKKLPNVKPKRVRKRKVKDKPLEKPQEKPEVPKEKKLTKQEIKLLKTETKRLREIEIANEAAKRALAPSSIKTSDAQKDSKIHSTDVELFKLTSRLINAEYQRYKTEIKIRSMGDGFNGKRKTDDCDIKNYSCACDLSAFLINDDNFTNTS